MTIFDFIFYMNYQNAKKNLLKTTAECLVIGDLNIDIILSELDRFPELDSEVLSRDYDMVIGGSGGIFTAVLSMLGIKTEIISRIGNDVFGRFLINEMEKNKAGTEAIIVSENEKTGVTLSLSYSNGKSQISSIDIIKNLEIEDINLESLESIKHVHFPSYYMMENLKVSYVELIKKIKLKSKKITFSMDTNDDPGDKWGKEVYDIFPHLDILFLNKKEALKITRQKTIEKAIALLEDYVKKIVIKTGIEGYYSRIDGKDYRGHCINKGNKNFLDSTGAGDNFDAAFIFGFLKNLDIAKTLEFANHCAEKSIEYTGGVGTYEKYAVIKKHVLFEYP